MQCPDKHNLTRTMKLSAAFKVSHEIRNPVALINSFLQLLAVNHPELKDDNCFLKIEENMDFLKGLLDELSTYNHSHTANTEDTNPYLLLQDLTASAAALLESQGIELQLTKETAVPRIPIDKIKFQQLISNLIRNAAESMSDGGTIISACPATAILSPSKWRTPAAVFRKNICRRCSTFL